MMKKKGNIGVGTIVSAILVLVFMGVLLSVLKSTIPIASNAYYDLATTTFANTTVYGTEASAFANDTVGYMGWFWILGAFVMVVMLVLGIFGLRRQ